MGGRGKSKLASNVTIYTAINQLNGQALQSQTASELRQAVRQAQDDQTSQTISVSDLVNLPASQWGEAGRNLFPDLAYNPATNPRPPLQNLLLGSLRSSLGQGVNRVTDGALQAIVQSLQTGVDANLRLTRDGTLVSSVANSKLYKISVPHLYQQINQLHT